MSENFSNHELLLRQLDGHAAAEEGHDAVDLLRTDPEARAFLREVAEQAVMIADLERIVMAEPYELPPEAMSSAARSRIAGKSRRFWTWPMGITAAAIALLAVVSLQVFATWSPAILRVSKVTGSTQYIDSHGRTVQALDAGTSLRAGDMLETRSCDAWIELQLRNGSTMTIAGNSALRVLSADGDGTRFKLLRGNLWVNPAKRAAAEDLLLITTTATVETRDAQLDIQTSETAMIARINRGSARVTRIFDGSAAEVPAAGQVSVALGNTSPLAVIAQPKPVNRWVCDLTRVPEVILGKWLPPNESQRARLGAAPLLWPVSEEKSVMLYAVALAAWKISDRPVLLQSDAQLRFRGRTQRAKTVRFGFSTQRMRGVFAGKFEVDVRPVNLGPVGATWEVPLALSDFRALHPQLSNSPAGLELTDVYALTIDEDAGLEINGIELQPANEAEDWKRRAADEE